MDRHSIKMAAKAFDMVIKDHYMGDYNATVDARMVFLFLVQWMDLTEET